MATSTGQKCPTSGIWQADCRDREQIALSVNETFPPCPKCRYAVNWRLVRATQRR